MADKNIVVAPDSFKGTLDAQEICSIVSGVIQTYIPDAKIMNIPMSDGGEGMVDSYLQQIGGEKITVQVTGPRGSLVQSEYGILRDGTAVMEMASCAGLPLMEGCLDPMNATTYGVGELIDRIEKRGLETILLGIGGSATNDMGIGMAAALGYEFLDGNYQELEPKTFNLGKIEHIRKPREERKIKIIAACDVDTPLYGPKGATYTFGKQKGVAEEQMEKLDQDMEHLAGVVKRELGMDLGRIPGGGAAGGLGAALAGFLQAELKPGIELFLDKICFDELLRTTDLVFTGEGRIDWQSLAGKVPIGIAKRAARAGVPCVALCGSVGFMAERAYEEGMSAIFSAIKDFTDQQNGKEGYAENIRFLADSVMRILMLKERGRAL